jgi:predicted CXXCH cytochrome family protein
VATSADCRSCHSDIATTWADSDHAKAHRPVDRAADADAFQPAREFAINQLKYQVDWPTNRPELQETRPGEAPHRSVVEFVLGHHPLRQYVIPTRDGRFQMSELAFDPVKKDWFNVFGAEQRTPGEWGHWTGRGMSWNAMCAHCHLTDFRKNYDAATDTYASTWREHGVGCAQCHGDMPEGHGKPGRPTPAGAKPPPLLAQRQAVQETCAPCHARNELLTGEVRPGVRYADHHRLTLPVEVGLFYPDGQMRDEVFNYTSVLTSRMGGKAGVTCLDCHDPHSGKTILPVANNMLCLQCHGGVGRQGAPVIDPTAHSHHPAASTGNRCISCHMPTTTYMQRDPRHDHGFLKPDPLLTKELAIPNACSTCHPDQNVDWAIARTDEWYGAKMESRQRERARVVHAAQNLAPQAAEKLLALLPREDIPAWRATLLLLARPFLAEQPGLVPIARKAL